MALSRFHMLGIGTGMMKKLMKESKMPSLDEFIEIAEGMGVKMIACTTTCGVMGISPEPENFRKEVWNMAGAAHFLNEARLSRVTLFI